MTTAVTVAAVAVSGRGRRGGKWSDILGEGDSRL